MFFLGVKFCMIVKSNEAQWKAMNVKFILLFKSPNMSHFEKNIINIVVGNLMIVTALNQWLHVNDCWIFLDLDDASHLTL
jgi:hypothetical protein